ncbi:glyoxylate/hydroxypyruvate reductase A [Loktanella sp. SALINAS62]|uniref:2-hydroxyacid dehydrogenase n=1 Tax=Loktanella sp. SALINAS62 TaxID=2706124 RepID=UPI001B8AC4E4|nr:glyoxylate/hydroxypyruvate reductase A [Loktanella sp. SALINAS62]MBS1304055.1 glyoxylate/hydroxypyruvate reductase A [Loktanella sp. SALINAS62]
MIRVLFSARPDLWDEYRDPLRDAFAAAGLSVDLARDHAPADVDYIVFAPNGPVSDFTPYVNTKLVMGLWAGVETIVGNTTLTQPLARMVDPALTQGMVEWVVGHTMRHHLGMDLHIAGQDGVWRNSTYPPLAKDRPVTILGLGALGEACGKALSQLGFPVTGWSRSAKEISGIRCLSGDDGLTMALRDAQIIVLLLPLTPQTENTLNADRLALLAPGAFIVNPGRGPLIDDDALLAALGTGQIGGATLDVFRQEPLPVDHPFWTHPHVLVTPHIASTTRPVSASQVVADNIRRVQAGEPALNIVDRAAGY